MQHIMVCVQSDDSLSIARPLDIDGLAQDCSISSVSAMEKLQPGTEPPI